MSGDKEIDKSEQILSNQPDEVKADMRSGSGCWGWMAASALFVVLLIFASSLWFKAGMNYAGYCFAEGRVLSDEEKIRAVIKHVLQKYPPAVISTPVGHGWTVSAPLQPIHYKDVDEFLATNPGCCELTQTRSPEEGVGFTFMERLKGTASSFARIDYQVRYWDNGALKSALSKNHFAASNCGEPQQEPFRRF